MTGVVEAGAAWAARLDAWRAQERDRVTGVVVLLDAQRDTLGVLVAAWANIAPKPWTPPPTPPPVDDREAWAALWPPLMDFVQPARQATALPESEVTAALRMAVVNRVLYPDGTLTEGARAFLASESTSILGKRVKR